MKAYVHGILASLSQLLNAVCGGHPNMTLSARAYLEREKPCWAFIEKSINTLFFWQHDHCFWSWQQDVRFCAGLDSLKDGDV